MARWLFSFIAREFSGLEDLAERPEPWARDLVLRHVADDDPSVSSLAIRACAVYGDPEPTPSIVSLMGHRNAEVRADAGYWVQKVIDASPDANWCRRRVYELGGPALREAVVRLIQSGETDQAGVFAAKALRLGEATDPLVDLLVGRTVGEDDWVVIGNAAEALASMPPGPPSKLIELVRHVRAVSRGEHPVDESPSHLWKRAEGALRVLAAWRCPLAMEDVAAIVLTPREWSLASSIDDYLAAIGDERAVELLFDRALHSTEPIDLGSLHVSPFDPVRCLGKVRTGHATTALLTLSRASSPSLRRRAEIVLADEGDENTISALLPILEEPDLKDQAYDVIESIERRLGVRTPARWA